MRDIWGVLLQTLTASGAAVLLLTVKGIFRDKLPPRWQFAIWGLLAMVLLIPAGCLGRYVLINWPLLVETGKSMLTGDYTLTQVIAPIPLFPMGHPKTVWEWLYLLYLVGSAGMLTCYLIGYLRLRWALRCGQPAKIPIQEQIHGVAERYRLKACPAVEVEGLSSAFVCGALRPVLVLPAGIQTDEKVLLHELLHRTYHDVVWGIVICLFRCVHWCNPLLWYCADAAGNDLEALCDQRVLERLEGEDRRDYGRILLSMANEAYARAPGTSSMANGGKHICRRIECITRFKQYPAGMALVSMCVAGVLATPLLLGTQGSHVYREEEGGVGVEWALASARTVWCTTPAGALDAYGKALLEQSGAYRAMCAPMDAQRGIADEMQHRAASGWDVETPNPVREEDGYAIYNLEPMGEDCYKALVIVRLSGRPDGRPIEENQMVLALQDVQVKKEGRRFVVLPTEPLRIAEVEEGFLTMGSPQLPCYTYAGTAEDVRVEVNHQKIFVVDNTIETVDEMGWFMGPSTQLDRIPRPHAQFDTVYQHHWMTGAYVGNERESITQMGISIAAMEHGEPRPTLYEAYAGNAGGSTSGGVAWASRELELGWDTERLFGGGGGSGEFNQNSFLLPECYAADLYLNGAKVAEVTLDREEGGRP